MIDAAAVVWIDTMGRFRLSTHTHSEYAEELAEAYSESGYPAIVLTRDNLIEQATGLSALSPRKE